MPFLGPCTRETLRCADSRSYAAELRACCRANLIQVVAATVAALQEHGATFWADYGTLLGAVRNPLTRWADYPWLPQGGKPTEPLEPGIIPHDKDADFGVLWAEWPTLMRVRADLERQGYEVLARPQSGSLKVRLSTMNYTNLDLFGWRDRPDGRLARLQYIRIDDFKGRDFPADWLKPFATVEWEGLTLPAPADPAAFCAFRYGPGWGVPIAANHDGVQRP